MMAVAVSLLPTRVGIHGTTTNQTSTRVICWPSRKANVSFALNWNSCRTGVNYTRRRGDVVACSAVSGSPGIESSSNAEDAASLLDTVKVFDLNGNGIPISDLWKDRTAVIAFARHFGCVFCRKRADYLASKKDIMDKSGVALVLIGPGSINQAKSFSEQTKFKGEVYADPSHSSYEALRFVSGVTTTFTPKAGLKIIQLYMEGYRQDWKLSFEQDTVSRGGWQQGGILVAGPGKSNILYIHKDKEAGDDPDIKDVLNACCGVHLEIETFEGVEAIPEWLANHACLEDLTVRFCDSLKYLPSVEAIQRLTKLKEIRIVGCPLLEERCRRGAAQSFPRFVIFHSSRAFPNTR